MKKALLFALTAMSASFAYGQDFDSKYLAKLGNPSNPITEIKSNLTLSRDSVYILSGRVYVKNGATLTIPHGTVIMGDTIASQKGVLIITKTGKIMAEGTAEDPIVFTSARKKGQKRIGDWGGLVIFGAAPMNQPAATTEYEGGIIKNPNDAEDAHFGGTDDNHNSGVVKYVRIEYAGFPLQVDREVNSLTMGGVGKGTELHHIMVSYGGDDSYEWFGGNVNAKYLVALNGTDDDFDVDFGYSGNVQFGVTLRDKDIADKSGSTAFESDNDGSGSAANPFTSGNFSNFTAIGPKKDASTTVNAFFTRAAHLRRNTRIGIFNSVMVGWPTGVVVDGSSTATNAANGDLAFKYNLVQGANKAVDTTGKTAGKLDPTAWFGSTTNSNTKLDNASDIMLEDAWNYTGMPNFNPKTGSPVLTGANWSDSRLSSSHFTQTTYRGAFAQNDNWMDKWTNFRPDTTNYLPGALRQVTAINGAEPAVSSVELFPNPAQNSVTFSFINTKSQNLTIRIMDLSGKVVAEVAKSNFMNGINAININTAELGAGLYMVSVTGENGAAAAYKLSIVK